MTGDPWARTRHVESNLPDGIGEALQEIERVLGIARGRWPEVPSLRVVVETLAVVKVADELQEEEEISPAQAIQDAASLMGMSPQAVARRLRRWQSADTPQRT